MLNSLFGSDPDSRVLEEVLNFIRAFYLGCGIASYNDKSDRPLLESTLISARAAIRQLDNPSPFKKVAAFTHCFVFQCPLSANLPDSVYPPEVAARSYHNAVVAFEISRACLHGAVIGEDGKKKMLKNRIEISRHQHNDLMIAFCEINEMKDAYTRLIALIYETLAYEFNDGVRYLPSEPLL